jgi:hypothetical protein
MKINEILEHLKRQQHLFENTATVEVKKELTSTVDKYKNTPALTKEEVKNKWDMAISSQNAFEKLIKDTISLLSNLLTVPVDEVFETYNENNLKTMFWLMHNSNYKLNAIIERMRQTNIGKLQGYDSKGNKKKLSANGFYDKDGKFDANTDLFDLIKSLFFYKNGEWVDAFYNLYTNGNFLKLNDLKKVTVNQNLFDILLKTGLPAECLIELASIQGSKTPNRGKFETLLVLLSENGRFQAGKDNTYNELGNLYRNELNGDIIIDGVPIEVKTDMGAGGGRVGGQGGFNAIAGIKNSYKKGLKRFLDFYKQKFASQIPSGIDESETNNPNNLKSENQKFLQKYEKCGAISLKPNSSCVFIDTIISETCALIIKIVGNIDNNVQLIDELKNEIIEFYSSIWCCNAAEDTDEPTGANAAIKKLIATIISSNTILNIANSGRVIPEENFDNFAQMACACMLGHYASIEEFEFMFIISTNPEDLKIPKARMAVIDKATLKGFINNPASVLNTDIYFSELPTTYGKNPSRATRPMLTLKKI